MSRTVLQRVIVSKRGDPVGYDPAQGQPRRNLSSEREHPYSIGARGAPEEALSESVSWFEDEVGRTGKVREVVFDRLEARSRTPVIQRSLCGTEAAVPCWRWGTPLRIFVIERSSRPPMTARLDAYRSIRTGSPRVRSKTALPGGPELSGCWTPVPRSTVVLLGSFIPTGESSTNW